MLPLAHRSVAPEAGVHDLVAVGPCLLSGQFTTKLGQFAFQLGMKDWVAAGQPHRRPPPLTIGRDIQPAPLGLEEHHGPRRMPAGCPAVTH